MILLLLYRFSVAFNILYRRDQEKEVRLHTPLFNSGLCIEFPSPHDICSLAFSFSCLDGVLTVVHCT